MLASFVLAFCAFVLVPSAIGQEDVLPGMTAERAERETESLRTRTAELRAAGRELEAERCAGKEGFLRSYARTLRQRERTEIEKSEMHQKVEDMKKAGVPKEFIEQMEQAFASMDALLKAGSAGEFKGRFEPLNLRLSSMDKAGLQSYARQIEPLASWLEQRATADPDATEAQRARDLVRSLRKRAGDGRAADAEEARVELRSWVLAAEVPGAEPSSVGGVVAPPAEGGAGRPTPPRPRASSRESFRHVEAPSPAIVAEWRRWTVHGPPAHFAAAQQRPVESLLFEARLLYTRFWIQRETALPAAEKALAEAQQEIERARQFSQPPDKIQALEQSCAKCELEVECWRNPRTCDVLGHLLMSGAEPGGLPPVLQGGQQNLIPPNCFAAFYADLPGGESLELARKLLEGFRTILFAHPGTKANPAAEQLAMSFVKRALAIEERLSAQDADAAQELLDAAWNEVMAPLLSAATAGIAGAAQPAAFLPPAGLESPEALNAAAERFQRILSHARNPIDKERLQVRIAFLTALANQMSNAKAYEWTIAALEAQREAAKARGAPVDVKRHEDQIQGLRNQNAMGMLVVTEALVSQVRGTVLGAFFPDATSPAVGNSLAGVQQAMTPLGTDSQPASIRDQALELSNEAGEIRALVERGALEEARVRMERRWSWVMADEDLEVMKRLIRDPATLRLTPLFDDRTPGTKAGDRREASRLAIGSAGHVFVVVQGEGGGAWVGRPGSLRLLPDEVQNPRRPGQGLGLSGREAVLGADGSVTFIEADTQGTSQAWHATSEGKVKPALSPADITGMIRLLDDSSGVLALATSLANKPEPDTVWVGPGSDLRPILRRSATVPCASLFSFSARLSPKGQYLVFQGSVVGGPEKVWRWGPDGVVPIADASPEGPLGQVAQGGLAVDDEGRVVIVTEKGSWYWVAGSLGPTVPRFGLNSMYPPVMLRDGRLFVPTPGMRLLGAPDALSPYELSGTSEGQFEVIHNGQVAFRCNSPDLEGKNVLSLWAGRIESPVLVVRVGDRVEVKPGEPLAVQEIFLPGEGPHVNGRGEVVFELVLQPGLQKHLFLATAGG